MSEWKRIEPTDTEAIGHRAVVTKRFIMPDGTTGEFQTFNREGVHFAGVVALTTDRQVITAVQFRPGPEKMMYEIPGGGVEANEDFKHAAVRELQEETGYVPGKVTELGVVYKDAYNNGTWHYYFAEDCELDAHGQQLDEGEHVDVKLISVADFLANARTARMTDTEAVFLAYDRLKELMDV